jgi:large conductance mechanosensitive channel
MKNFIYEFKQFIARGNVIDLAVGIVVGGAFGKIISSLVGDVIMPLINMLLGHAKRFTEWQAGPVLVGNFLQSLLDFLIISFIIFLAIKAINRLKREEKKQEPQAKVEEKISNQERLLIEIRDLLKKQVQQ